MFNWKKHILLFVGIFLIIASAVILAQATSNQASCESIGGQIVRFIDAAKDARCANVKIWLGISYAGLAIGLALSIINFVRRDGKRRK